MIILVNNKDKKKDRKVRYLEEKRGIRSLIRLQSIVTLLFTLFVIGYQVWTDNINVELDALLVFAAFAPKSVQKFAEARLYSRRNEELEEEINQTFTKKEDQDEY